MSALPWTSTTQVPPMTADALHVWGLTLNLTSGSNTHLWPLLSEDEQQRAQRFVRDQDQEKFVQVRGSLRRLLGAYLDLAPEDLHFEYGEYGKPQLTAACNPLNLHFNVSHSHALALIAVTQAVEVGIDIEQVNSQVEYQNISRRFFAEVEYQALIQQPVEQQCQIFFQLWTRKEACIKAMGGSIAHALDQITVAESLQEPTVTISVKEQSQTHQLFVHTLVLGKDYASAVATTQRLRHLSTWQWDSHIPC